MSYFEPENKNQFFSEEQYPKNSSQMSGEPRRRGRHSQNNSNSYSNYDQYYQQNYPVLAPREPPPAPPPPPLKPSLFSRIKNRIDYLFFNNDIFAIIGLSIGLIQVLIWLNLFIEDFL